MSKKMHRCPYCGGKGYSFFTTSRTRHSRYISRNNYNKYGTRDYGGGCDECINDNLTSVCNACNNRSAVYRNDGETLAFVILMLFILILTVVLSVLHDVVGFFVPLISLVILIILLYVSSFYSCYFGCLLPIRHEGSRNYLMVSSPNCKVKLNDNKYIRKMWVYGLKFSTETKNIKFKERFTDGLVPAQFYPAKDGSNEFEIRIIGKEFVPDEILFEGAEFLVEDIDGLFICKGKVTKTELDY